MTNRIDAADSTIHRADHGTVTEREIAHREEYQQVSDSTNPGVVW